MARFIPQPQPRLGPLTLGSLKPWAGTAGRWGVAAGAAVTLFMSVTPIFQKDVLLKIPVLSTYFEDNTPASDKPF
ncbi:ubiquinol-cytochrome-C reductase complex subunit [Rhizoctonia solani AG-3 Rhs1AP]|uniref:Ubiquinol-cytochrome-C reductase complex subunit n=2 Tax=Rhizoctonia solani AG-3 TaxID=1086053 RepID=A0A074SJG2_9AGAM|nr:ubiquinol-cytochrome-C reductase complex subunit [Rhizoctonia solani AG-3 Rhs1AP]KEP50137.1 ubiquinol-cytochrome-C reductase complex subunit [Rhizoctonia solani 123E]